MKLSQKKQNEIVVWEYFIPSNCEWESKTDRDIEMFFEWSEQGKHKELLTIPAYKQEGRTYFHALVWGKKWAGINMHELYEKGVLDGTMPYFTILSVYDKFEHPPIPRPVVDFMKKELFKGKDADIIEKIYLDINN